MANDLDSRKLILKKNKTFLILILLFQKKRWEDSDSKSKIITLLLYLNESWEYETGKLRMLKNEENLDDFIL